jgi:Ion channel
MTRLREFIAGLWRRFLATLCMLVLGPDQEKLGEKNLGCSYQKQRVGQVWNGQSFGLYRAVRLALAAAPFAFPTVWITQLIGNRKGNRVRFSSDAYVGVRAALLAWLLWCGWIESWVPTIAVFYFLTDIVVYVAALVFLADIDGTEGPIPERSLLFLLVNYGEIILAFAVLHHTWGGLNVDPLNPREALYFSAVTATTIGYGDISPAKPNAQLRVLAEMAVSFMFAAALLAAILGRLASTNQRNVTTASGGLT